MSASKNGLESVVTELLRRGADLNVINYKGITAVYLACKYNHEQIALQLVAAGADPTKGQSALTLKKIDSMPTVKDALIAAIAAKKGGALNKTVKKHRKRYRTKVTCRR